MKPLLERKRRARINKCLDSLKDIMVSALQSEGESITKLEKADVLELTVRHLQKLKRQNALGLTPQATYAGRFRAGYSHCAQEVSNYMTVQKDVNIEVTTRLFSHLGNCITALESMPPSVLSMAVPPPNPTNLTGPGMGPVSPIHMVPTSSLSPTPSFPSPSSTTFYNNCTKEQDQLAPLDLIKLSAGKENQAQDLSMNCLKIRQPLATVKEENKWRPW
jgi:hairy-and-enhancer-of-split protein